MPKPPMNHVVLLTLGVLAGLAGCTTPRLARAVPGKPVLIQGRVLFPGTPPPEQVIPVPPAVLAARTNTPLTTRFHRVSADGGLADVVVYVKRGLEGQTFPTTTNTQVIRVTGFEFWPYIAAVEMGQPIRWENHQSASFNLNPTPTNLPSRQFNHVLLPDRPVESAFLTPEEFVRVKTDVYPWLFHYVSVFDHPYFAVTDAEGRFRFPRPLPPGKYTLAAVHRRAGESTRELVVNGRFDPTKPLVLTLGPAQGRDAILRKLAETRLPEVIYDGLPLPEVLKMLEHDTKRYDPAKQGVRFAVRAPVNPARPALTLDSVLIKVNTVLRDVSVLDALDAIVRTADAHTPDGRSAGLQYTIETNRVVFQGRATPPPFIVPAKSSLTPRQRALLQRLDTVVFPEVVYDGLPLPEVMKMLEQDAKRYDPEKKGFNFLAISTGQPGHATNWVDLDTVLIQLPTVVKNLTVRQVLDVVCQTAEVKHPDGESAGLRYSVEDYGILFTPRELGQPFAPPRLVNRPVGAAVRAKLDRTIIPSIRIDDLPLAEVIKLLTKAARQHDPDKQGVNLLATRCFPDKPPGWRSVQIGPDGKPMRPAPANRGQPAAPAATPVIQPHASGTLVNGLSPSYVLDPPALDTLIITVRQPLIDRTLAQVLDAVCQGSPYPITYRLEDYGVLFTPDYTKKGLQKLSVPTSFTPPHPELSLATPVTPAAPGPASPIKPAQAGEHCDRLEALGKTLRANPATPAQDFANVAGLIEQALAKYTAVLPPTAPELARLKNLLNETKPPAPKPGASLPPPVGADVRRLTPTAAVSGQQSAVSQRLVTSSPTAEAEGGARLSQRAAAVPPADGGLGQTRPTAAAPAPHDPVAEAEAEVKRRQEKFAVLTNLLTEAEQFRKIQSWTNAVVRYEEAVGHAKLLGGVETVEKQYRDVLAGLTHCRIQLAVALLEKFQFKAAAAEVDKVLPFEPNSSQVAEFKRFNERVEAAHQSKLVQTETYAAERATIPLFMRDGKLYFEVGEYREARQRFEEVIALDPANEAALFYWRLVVEAEFARARRLREGTYASRVVEAGGWGGSRRANASPPVPNPYARTNSQAPFLTHSSKGAQRINRKLDQIVLPEVHFDGVPLVGVVQRLIEDAKKFDPEKQGLNFLINDAAPAAPLLDAAGNPVPVARPVLLSEGLVRISTPLKHLTLRQALDVICKTTELPTQFSVEEYAIAFIPRGPVAYYARTFRVNPDTFIQGLRGVVGQAVPAAGSVGQASPTVGAGGNTGPVRATIPATVPAAQRTAAEANALVRQFFLSAGVTSLSATNSSTQVQFNPQTGALVVRGTTNDLRLIEQALGKLPPSPPTQK